MEARGERNAGLGGLRNERARGPLRYGPSGSERAGCSHSWCSTGIVFRGVKQQAWEEIVIRAVRKSVTSTRGGT